MPENKALPVYGSRQFLLHLLAQFLALCCSVAYGIAADEGEPLLRLEAGGPTGYVTSLAFSPDGQTLYAGSWDKTVRVWRLQPSGKFELDPAAWRIPIGPGLDGAINAIAVSADGNWLAAAGRPVVRGASDYRNPGRVLPTTGGMTDEMRQDEGTIYLFDTRNRVTRTLRGHRGEVRSLAFAPSEPERPLLVSAAREWDERSGKFTGSVRLWDALAEQPYVTGRLLPEPRHETWPKLAANRTGAGVRGIDVAIAWGDGVFRVWNVATESVREAAGQGQYQDTVTRDERDGRFITGALGDNGSTRLRYWNAPARTLNHDTTRSVEIARSTDAVIVPRALAMASSKAGAKADVLVSIVHRHYVKESEKDQYEIWLAPTPLRVAEMKALRLASTGPPPRRLPVLAAVPGGKHVAITTGLEIQVFAIADLLARRVQPQVLRSAGASFGSVAFLSKPGTSLALGMSARRGTTPGASIQLETGDLVFDFEKAALSEFAADAGWKVAAAPEGGWQIGPGQAAAGDTGTRQRWQLRENGMQRSVIDLPVGHEVTGYALAANRQPPILALATHHDGLPALSLYNAATGDFVRQLSAHAGLIRSLAFSAGGGLLASTADDQTVCIWRLADLDKIVGQRGLAAGIAVRQTPAGLVVEMDEEKAPQIALKNGDVLQGRVIGDELNAWKTAREFYDTFWNATPGDKIQVRRSRAGAAVAAVAVDVAQGADERKPLLSLFVTRDEAVKDRGWIGWSPLGPYQASGVDVERHLGWHFNTGRPQSPVAFAGADQYREKYSRQGLLEALIKTGLPPKEPEPVKLERPDLDLVLDGKDPQPLIGLGDGLMRYPPTKASLVVGKFAAANIDRVELKIDAGPPLLLERQLDGGTWSAALDLAAWKPGEHRIIATLHTREATSQVFATERQLRYQRPAPLVTLKNPKPPSGAEAVEQEKYAFAATVAPGAEGQPMEVVLRRRNGNKVEMVKEWKVDQRLEINETITLVEGGNVIELEARNQNALQDFESAEVATQQRTVNYKKQIRLEIVSAKPLIEDRPLPTTGPEGIPLVVTVDKIKLSGELKDVEGPLAMGSSQGGTPAEVTTVPAVGGKPAQFTTGDIVLKPGVQTVQVKRKVAGSLSLETGLIVDFRPPLPTVLVQSPKEDVVLVEGRDPGMLKLSATMPGPKLPYPFVVIVLVNGRPAKVAPTIDVEAGTLIAEIPLELGENQVALQVSNEWNPSRIQPVAKVQYLSLPTVTTFSEIGEVKSPTIDVVVSGKSALPVTHVEAAGVQLPKAAIRYDQRAGQWQATIRDVALQGGPFELSVHAWNEHGRSLAAGSLKLPAWKKPEPPPMVELARGTNVTRANYDVLFSVRSKSPLRSVKLQHNGVALEYAPKLDDLKPTPDGWYLFEAQVPLLLKPGSNRLGVLAANEGGSQTDETVVNYIDPPARIVIDRMETADLPSRQRLSVVTKDGRVQADKPAPTGKVMVYGHVEWSKSADEALMRRSQRIQVWVNGFQQAPVVLDPPGANLSGEFAAFVVLNQAQDNRIQFGIPEMTTDLSTAFDVYVNCDKPIQEQRLHLLVISVGAPRGSEAEIEKQVLAAMKARPAGREFRTSAFNRIAIYGPLVGADITPQQIRHQLSEIKVKIDELYRANRTSVLPANDVIMIYLQGGQLVNIDPDFFVTIRPTDDPRTARAMNERDPRIFREVALHSRTIADFLTETTGAHLLLLDVAGSPEAAEAARWPDKSRAAMLRYTWLKDTAVPPKVKLLAALPEAIQAPGKLREVGERIEDIHLRLAAEYPQSISYNRRVPEILQTLLLGEPGKQQMP